MKVFERFRTSFLCASLMLSAATWSVAQTPQLIKDINPSGNSLDENSGFTQVGGGKVLFFAKDNTNGNEPWITDGTAAGTFLLADLNVGSAPSFPISYSAVSDAASGKAYFTAYNNSINDIGIFVTDGTKAGTKLFYQPDFFPNNLTFFAGKVFYTDTDSGLKSTDGTSAGTKQVLGLNFKVYPLLATKDKLYCSVKDPNAGFFGEWFLYSINTSGVAVKEAFTKSSSSDEVLSIFEGKAGLYVSAGSNQNADISLYTPSTGKTTKLLSATGDFVRNFETFKGKDHFLVNNKFYESDGTVNGTKLLKTFSHLSFYWSKGMFAKTDNYLYINGQSSAEGQELWTYNPNSGIVNIDINAGSADSYPYNMVSVGNKIYFVAKTADKGTELMESNGTKAGTKVVADLNPGTADGYPVSPTLVTLGSKKNLIFYATEPSKGTEPYRMEVEVISPVREQLKPLEGWLSVAPNPSSDYIIVGLEQGFSEQALNWQLIDITGKTLQQGSVAASVTQFELSTALLSDGIYFMKIQTVDGKIALSRIAVKH